MTAERQLSQLVINLAFLEENFIELRKLQPNKEVLFMVKADAYGHGLIPIVEFSCMHLGVNAFGVASLDEAMSIRKDLPELLCDIYVFSEVALELKNNLELYENLRIFPVISSHNDLDIFLSKSELKYFPLCLKFNTGMNRLGFSCEESLEVAEKIKNKGRSEVFHLMSHLANASMPLNKNKRNIVQREKFEKLKEDFKNSGLNILHSSIANSASLEQGLQSNDDYIRPGLMLYGSSSLSPKHKDLSLWKGHTISSLETTILRKFPVKKGDPLSYGSTPCPENGNIIILPLGYGDGVSTSYQGARINLGEHEGHICARVCMDMTTVLLDENVDLEEGQRVTLWGHESGSLNRLSEQTKVIPYELVIQVTARVPRIYKS